MKVLILAGGLGSRISEETTKKPKPMVEIGGKPILWHIMKIYSSYGYNDFIILCGYRAEVIKEYFANYYRYKADMTINMEDDTVIYHRSHAEPWKVTMVDTGANSGTGGRIKQVQEYVGNEPFMLTYGDGVADINISELVSFHNSHGKAITMTAVQPEARWGALDIDDNDLVSSFLEKPQGDGQWINGGFFVCQPEVFDYINGDAQVFFEREPLELLAKDSQLLTYKHRGFWKPMDTLRDKMQLEEMLENGTAPWKKW